MGGQKHRHLRSVRNPGDLERLLAAITELAEQYPRVVAYTRVRSCDVGGGSAGAGHVPINIAALDLLRHSYWAADHPPHPDSEADAACYLPGIELTILGRHAEMRPPPVPGLEDGLRAALGLGPVARYLPVAGKDGVEAKLTEADDHRVLDALAWFRVVAAQVVDEMPEWAELLCDELRRLASRARCLIDGARFRATYSDCDHCGGAGTVISDGSVACCRNPSCRDAAGERRGWRLDRLTGAWVGTAWPSHRREVA
jgi:hypothetical protein